jgi:hypothetical protein
MTGRENRHTAARIVRILNAIGISPFQTEDIFISLATDKKIIQNFIVYDFKLAQLKFQVKQQGS